MFLQKSGNSLRQKKVIFSKSVTLLPVSKSTSPLSQTSTSLNMVLTIPENIIEQSSTIKQLDDLIDRSVRTTARKPIMMQFQPTPYWVSVTLQNILKFFSH